MAKESKIYVENRQARFLYHLEAGIEAGLVLQGWEVKAILAGQATFNGGAAYIKFINGEAFLEGSTITPLKQANLGLFRACEPGRARKLLLKQDEIEKLGRKVNEKGFTVVPVALTYNGKFKLMIALAKGKNHADKRETIKSRELSRELSRSLNAY